MTTTTNDVNPNCGFTNTNVGLFEGILYWIIFSIILNIKKGVFIIIIITTTSTTIDFKNNSHCG